MLLSHTSSFRQQFQSRFLFFTFYISFNFVHFSLLSPFVLYLYCTESAYINYLVQNKLKWAQTPPSYASSHFIVMFFLQIRSKYITDTRREKYLDLFVWDSTTAMSEGEMETAMMLLPVHRTTLLTFSKVSATLANGLCNISLANLRDH